MIRHSNVQFKGSKSVSPSPCLPPRVVPASATGAVALLPLLVLTSWTSSSAWRGQEPWAGSWTCRAWRMTRQNMSWKWSSGTWSCARRRRRGWGETGNPLPALFLVILHIECDLRGADKERQLLPFSTNYQTQVQCTAGSADKHAHYPVEIDLHLTLYTLFLPT